MMLRNKLNTDRLYMYYNPYIKLMESKYTCVFALTPDTEREILLNLHGKNHF